MLLANHRFIYSWEGPINSVWIGLTRRNKKPRTSAFLSVLWSYDITMERQTFPKYEKGRFDQFKQFYTCFQSVLKWIINKILTEFSSMKKSNENCRRFLKVENYRRLLICRTSVWRYDERKTDVLGLHTSESSITKLQKLKLSF